VVLMPSHGDRCIIQICRTKGLSVEGVCCRGWERRGYRRIQQGEIGRQATINDMHHVYMKGAGSKGNKLAHHDEMVGF